LTLGPPPTETTWNEPEPEFGGAGGVSRFAVMPDYQRDAAPSVGVINAYSSGTPCGAPAGEFCHEVPDVSASSASDGGYDFYFADQWTDAFGTSFAAPLWAAFVSLVDASPACMGVGVGFVDPLLYKLAGEDYGKYFNDVTTGNNDVGDVNGGLYPAGPGYDMATGLGTPVGSALSEGLCPSAPSVTPPPTSENAPPTTSNPAPVTNAAPAADPAPVPRAKACTVPKLTGKSLAKAKAELKGAGCELGKVIKPSRRAKGKHGPLVVAAASPKAGAKTTTAISLRLAPQRAKRHS
jgi:hypothetical protein